MKHHPFHRHIPALPLAMLPLCSLFAGVVLALGSPSLAKEVDLADQRIALWQGEAPVGDGTTDPNNAFMTIHKPAKPNGASAIICPGGGYGGLVKGPEGHGIAKWMNDHGITGVVLEYRLPKGRPEVPLLDAQQAIRTVRSKAGELGLDPKRIGIVGFSAGGHLAATAATHFDNGNPDATDPVERASSRPDFAILIYPVITMGDAGHRGSTRNLLGNHPTTELLERFSNEKQVGDQTPPTFLAHALDDRIVPASNSQSFHEALKQRNIPTEYLELPSGGHGLNGYKGPNWDAWQRASLEWLGSLKLLAGTVDQ
jgi:acetyl esterase/lipase